MLGERKEIEDLDAAEDQFAGRPEDLEIRDQALETAREIDEPTRWGINEGSTQRTIEATARRIDEDEIRAGQGVETFPRGTRPDRRPGALGLGSGGESQREALQSVAAALVEMHRAGPAEERESDRSDTAIKFRDRRIGRNQPGHAFDRALEERKMVLAKGTRWKVHIDSADRLDRAGRTGQPNRRRTEDRVAAFGLGVEEESLQAVAETFFDDRRQIAQHVGCRSAADEYDLNAPARSFHHELQISKHPAMGSVGVRCYPRLLDRLANLRAHLVDQRMMHRTGGRVHDAMAARLEEADLGVPGVSANSQTCAVAMTAAR